MRLLYLLRHDLNREVVEWVNKGIISKEQGSQISGLYGLTLEHGKSSSFGILGLTLLASLSFGLAFIILIGQNWSEIPAFIRIGGLSALTLSSFLVGYYYQSRKRVNSAVGWFLFSSLLYGVSIFLIGQIFHLGEHFTDGFYWWSLGILPVGIAIGSSAVLGVSLIAIVPWMAIMLGLDTMPWTFGLLIIIYLLCSVTVAPSRILFISSYFFFIFFVQLLFNLIWHRSSQELTKFSALNILLLLAIFAIPSLFGRFKQIRKPALNEALILARLWGLRGIVVILLILSIERNMLDFLNGLAFDFSLNSKQFSAETILAAAVVTSLVLFGIGTYLMFQGIIARARSLFFIGVGVVISTFLIRFLFLLGDNYISSSFFFFVFGLLLVGAVFWWKKWEQKQLSKDSL